MCIDKIFKNIAPTIYKSLSIVKFLLKAVSSSCNNNNREK